MIDLRSDTVTKPTPEMLEYMLRAKVGDDVFGEDPTVNELQGFAANMFGVEAALFCPSGTMANQIAIKAQTHPGDELICDESAHVYYYEGGGIASNSGVATKTLKGYRGVFTAEQLQEVLRPENVHFPKASIVSIENTCNRGGGKVFDYSEIEKIRVVCDENELKLHLDGARLFNALVNEGYSPQDFGRIFDSISVCLSKGLGAPVGSLLLGNKTLINQSLRIRKAFGGGMRQAGLLAAAGIYALENNLTRLKDDHELASNIGRHLNSLRYVDHVLEPQTNMVVFTLSKNEQVKEFQKHLAANQIHAFEVGPRMIRFVTHLDLPVNSLDKIQRVLSEFESE